MRKYIMSMLSVEKKKVVNWSTNMNATTDSANRAIAATKYAAERREFLFQDMVVKDITFLFNIDH